MAPENGSAGSPCCYLPPVNAQGRLIPTLAILQVSSEWWNPSDSSAHQSADKCTDAHRAMARWIGILEGIVPGIAVSVQALRIARLRHDGICLHEAADDRIIPAGVVEQQAGAAVPALAGEAIVGW